MFYCLVKRRTVPRPIAPPDPPTLRVLPAERDIDICKQYDEDEGPPTIRRMPCS